MQSPERKAEYRGTPEFKARHRDYMRQYRAAHPDTIRRASKACYRRNVDRYRAKGRERYSAMTPAQKVEHAAKQAAMHLRRKYNMTPEAKKQMYEEQKGLCYLCAKPLPFVLAHVDHRHGTKLVRGLAHQVCNIRLGFIETALKRDPETLRTMLRVLGVIME